MKRYILFIIVIFTIVSTAVAQTEPDYLCITFTRAHDWESEENAEISIGGKATPDIQYSWNKQTWYPLTSKVIKVGYGTKMYFKGINPNGFSNSEKQCYFIIKGGFKCSGNIMTLIDGIGETTTIPSDYCFSNLFLDCHDLEDASEMVLPATTLTAYCYAEMFGHPRSRDKKLSKAPKELPATVLAEGCYKNMFASCLIKSSPSLPQTTILADKCYAGMFADCTELETAPELPATTLANECYSGMFSGCTALKATPALPATTMTYKCYSNMFYCCSSITTAPDLPATTLADECYSYMFAGCGLTSAPELPITTLADGCYSYMFSGCKLTSAPELLATSLTKKCYSGMFSGCKSLESAPELPATILAEYCYKEMFRGCSNLRNAPELPATNLAEYCYYGMFTNCTSLITAPKLPATILADYCYWEMFSGCSSLINAPELPATNLAKCCYYRMFMNCTSLTITPMLSVSPADYPLYDCYAYMFTECRQLQYVNVNFTKWDRNYTHPTTSYWLEHVAAKGIFIRPPALPEERNSDFIPDNWILLTVEDLSSVEILKKDDGDYLRLTFDRKPDYELISVKCDGEPLEFSNYKVTIPRPTKDVEISTLYDRYRDIQCQDNYITVDKTRVTMIDVIHYSVTDRTSEGYKFDHIVIKDRRGVGLSIPVDGYTGSFTIQGLGIEILWDYRISTVYYKTGLHITTDDASFVKNAIVDENDEVTITFTPRVGYVTSATYNGNALAITDNTATFTMPAENVIIATTYTPINYTITTDGNITANKSTATINDKISFTVADRSSEGLKLGKVLVNNVEFSGNSFDMKDYLQDVEIKAVYSTNSYSITTDDYSSTNQFSANYGDVIIVSFAQRSGCNLSSATYNGNQLYISDYQATFTMPAENVDIATEYTPISYSVTTYDQYVSVDKSTATINDVVNITIIDRTAENYTLTQLLVNGNEISSNGYTAQFSMSDYLTDVTIQAEYSYTEPPSNTYTISTDEYCTADKSTATFNDIVNITISDRTSEKYTLNRLLVNGNEISLNGYTAQLSMSDYLSNVTIQAEYTYKDPSNTTYYTITTNEYCSVDKYSVAEGDVVTVYINQRDGYSVNVYYNGEWLTSDYQASFYMPTEDVYIYAEYTEINSSQYYNVSTDQYSSTDKTQYAQGETIAVTFRQVVGKELVSATYNGNKLALNGYTASFVMPSNDVSILTEYKDDDKEAPIFTKSEYLSITPTMAKFGDEVTVFVSRRDGYTPHIYINGKEISVNGNIAKFTKGSSEPVEVTVDYIKDNTKTAVTEISGNNPAVSVYPNPARQGEKIVISIDGSIDLKNAKILIYNSHGALVKRIDHAAEYNELNLKSGIYNGVLIYKNGRQTFRIAVY
ncbi:MAG: hypothetical protein J6T70_13010 [Bacteroidales bacterium]|nr:hypothetical protein [Bacteroidales bacterium]